MASCHWLQKLTHLFHQLLHGVDCRLEPWQLRPGLWFVGINLGESLQVSGLGGFILTGGGDNTLVGYGLSANQIIL
jgi:hypothetical protein